MLRRSPAGGLPESHLRERTGAPGWHIAQPDEDDQCYPQALSQAELNTPKQSPKRPTRSFMIKQELIIMRLTPDSRAPAYLGLGMCRAGSCLSLFVSLSLSLSLSLRLGGAIWCASWPYRLGQVEPMWSMLGTSWAQVEPMLGLGRPMLGLCWPRLGLCWAYVGVCWPHVGICWPYVEPSWRLCWAYVGYLGPMLGRC